MKLGIIAMAAPLAVGVMAVEGVAENETGASVVTGSAEASCVEVDGQCVWACPPDYKWIEFNCVM